MLFEPDVSPFRPPELHKFPAQRRNPQRSFRVAFGERHHDADSPYLVGLLRACRHRPRHSRAAEQRDELASPHSITGSAVVSSAVGTVRPSVFAVLRLRKNSTFTDC